MGPGGDTGPQIVASPSRKFSRTLDAPWSIDSQKKISKFGATRCQILTLKCTEFDFRWGSAPHPAVGAYSAPTDPLAVFNGGLLLRGVERGKGGASPQYFGLEPPLLGWCIVPSESYLSVPARVLADREVGPCR